MVESKKTATKAAKAASKPIYPKLPIWSIMPAASSSVAKGSPSTPVEKKEVPNSNKDNISLPKDPSTTLPKASNDTVESSNNSSDCLVISLDSDSPPQSPTKKDMSITDKQSKIDETPSVECLVSDATLVPFTPITSEKPKMEPINIDVEETPLSTVEVEVEQPEAEARNETNSPVPSKPSPGVVIGVKTRDSLSAKQVTLSSFVSSKSMAAVLGTKNVIKPAIALTPTMSLRSSSRLKGSSNSSSPAPVPQPSIEPPPSNVIEIEDSKSTETPILLSTPTPPVSQASQPSSAGPTKISLNINELLMGKSKPKRSKSVPEESPEQSSEQFKRTASNASTASAGGGAGGGAGNVHSYFLPPSAKKQLQETDKDKSIVSKFQLELENSRKRELHLFKRGGEETATTGSGGTVEPPVNSFFGRVRAQLQEQQQKKQSSNCIDLVDDQSSVPSVEACGPDWALFRNYGVPTVDSTSADSLAGQLSRYKEPPIDLTAEVPVFRAPPVQREEQWSSIALDPDMRLHSHHSRRLRWAFEACLQRPSSIPFQLRSLWSSWMLHDRLQSPGPLNSVPVDVDMTQPVTVDLRGTRQSDHFSIHHPMASNAAQLQSLQSFLEVWSEKRKRNREKQKRPAERPSSSRCYDSDDEEFLDDGGEAAGLQNPFILRGGTATGKTMSVYHIAEKVGYKVIEISIPQVTGGQELLRKCSETVKSYNVTSMQAATGPSSSLFSSSGGSSHAISVEDSLILLDESDLILLAKDSSGSGGSVGGGGKIENAIRELIASAKIPIVITAERPLALFDAVPRELRQQMERIRFDDDGAALSVIKSLRRVAELSAGQLQQWKGLVSLFLYLTWGDLRAAMLSFDLAELASRSPQALLTDPRVGDSFHRYLCERRCDFAVFDTILSRAAAAACPSLPSPATAVQLPVSYSAYYHPVLTAVDSSQYFLTRVISLTGRNFLQRTARGEGTTAAAAVAKVRVWFGSLRCRQVRIVSDTQLECSVLLQPHFLYAVEVAVYLAKGLRLKTTSPRVFYFRLQPPQMRVIRPLSLPTVPIVPFVSGVPLSAPVSVPVTVVKKKLLARQLVSAKDESGSDGDFEDATPVKKRRVIVFDDEEEDEQEQPPPTAPVTVPISVPAPVSAPAVPVEQENEPQGAQESPSTAVAMAVLSEEGVTREKETATAEEEELESIQSSHTSPPSSPYQEESSASRDLPSSAVSSPETADTSQASRPLSDSRVSHSDDRVISLPIPSQSNRSQLLAECEALNVLCSHYDDLSGLDFLELRVMDCSPDSEDRTSSEEVIDDLDEHLVDHTATVTAMMCDETLRLSKAVFEAAITQFHASQPQASIFLTMTPPLSSRASTSHVAAPSPLSAASTVAVTVSDEDCDSEAELEEEQLSLQKTTTTTAADVSPAAAGWESFFSSMNYLIFVHRRLAMEQCLAELYVALDNKLLTSRVSGELACDVVPFIASMTKFGIENSVSGSRHTRSSRRNGYYSPYAHMQSKLGITMTDETLHRLIRQVSYEGSIE